MKKAILVTAFVCILGLAVPATSHADVGFGGRIDLGLDLLGILQLFNEVAKASDGEVTMIPIIPLLDAGFYGQLYAGPFRLGLGLRGFSFLVYINLFWPTLQAEVDLGSRITLNAKIGGGLFYLFPLWAFSAPMFAPEASIWFRLNESPRNRLQLGLGALSLLSASPLYKSIDSEVIRIDFRNFNSFVFYFAFKVSFNFGLPDKN
jgi:hypothetical protein